MKGLVATLLLCGMAAWIVAAFKTAECADDHGWAWWVPLFGCLAMALLFGIMALNAVQPT